MGRTAENTTFTSVIYDPFSKMVRKSSAVSWRVCDAPEGVTPPDNGIYERTTRSTYGRSQNGSFVKSNTKHEVNLFGVVRSRKLRCRLHRLPQKPELPEFFVVRNVNKVAFLYQLKGSRRAWLRGGSHFLRSVE